MKNRAFGFAVTGILVVVALAAFVPAASASMVTKIMYAQSNVETFAYTATGNGALWVHISWVDHNGAATQFPASEVDGGIIGPSGAADYNDFDVKTLYAGTNPVEGSVTAHSGSTYYISIYPYVDDCTATVTMKLGGSGGTNITCTRMSDGATVSSPQTVAADAADGELYVPSDGDWISTFQHVPGTASLYYADYNDYVYQRVAGTTYDTLSEAYAFAYYEGQLGGSVYGYQIPARTVLGTAPSDPKSGEWYSITPQVWPAAARPNVVDSVGNVMPGAISTTTAPAWYTYAYPDSSVTTQAPGYYWAPLTDAGARKRNFSSDVSTLASFGASFSGSSITWVFTETSASGVAKVTIDGVDKGTVDQYSPTIAYKQTQVFSGLSGGNHTIVITNNKTKNAASSNTYISHDAFLANGVNDASDPTPYMENNYDGETWYQWPKIDDAGASGGNYSTDVSTDAAFALEFTGSSITWKYTTNSACGKALVYIDGVLKETVDQYSPSLAYQVAKTYSGLAATTHIIMIANSKTKNAASSNTYVTSDAFVFGATTVEN